MRTPPIRASKETATPRHRGLRIATMGAGIAGSYVGYMLQRAFLGKDARTRKLGAAHARASRRMRNDLLRLRGPAMKLGQALSLQAGLLPDEALVELAALQREAPAMHPSLMRATFKSSLGHSPDDVFAEFDETPFAAASLGQVHRAVTRDGHIAAVKIQYPGIRQAVVNDFAWFRTIVSPAQATGHFPRSAVDEIEREITAETNYAREADNLEYFHAGLTPLPFVSVPTLFRAYSSDRVLTMSLLTGEPLGDFLARRPSQAVRDRLGAHLFTLFYFQLLRLGAFHADPHWGNYLFRQDGSLGMVDFGCVKRLTPAFVADLRGLFLYPGDRRSTDFHRLLQKRYALFGEQLSPAVHQALVDFAETFFRKVYPPEPEKAEQLFDFSDPGFLRDYMRCGNEVARTKGTLPEYLFLARAESGLYHTLHRLRARVATSKLLRQLLDA